MGANSRTRRRGAATGKSKDVFATTSVVRDAARGQTYVLEVDARTSKRLSRIRQKNTAPEVIVRRALFRVGVRFRLEARDLPGSPDIVNRKARLAIFVHGCFWHAHSKCPKATVPKRNRAFWLAKLEANRARDARARGELEALGFRVIVVWQCETEDAPALDAMLREALSPLAFDCTTR